MIYIVVSIACLAWSSVGWALCASTHAQRGIEVDEPVIPSHVPSDWANV